MIQNQRDRILDAMAEEVAAKGYPEVTVAGVIGRAGVSSKTFYGFFPDKAACFLAAYDAAIEFLMGHVAAVYEHMPEPTAARARAVLAAVLDVFASEPAFARMCMVEAAAAGAEANQRYVNVIDGFLPLVEEVENSEGAKRHRARHPDQRHPDRLLRHALVGGIHWIIYHHIVTGETQRLPDLLPQLTYYLLAPYLGERQAATAAFNDEDHPSAAPSHNADAQPA